MADRLTRSEYAMDFARSFLVSIARAIERDSARIDLSSAELPALFAEAHAWIAGAAMEAEDRVTARRHHWSSLRHRPQPDAALGLVNACLPPSALAALRRWHRRHH